MRACYDGQNNVLKGFVFGINDYGRSALFGTASHTDFQNIRLADCQANGMYAAMLGGYLSQCSIENCGAYLNTQDENGSYYNDMDARRAKYMVKGRPQPVLLLCRWPDRYGGPLHHHGVFWRS